MREDVPGHRVGRNENPPSPQQRQEFLNLLRAGNWIKTACEYTGVREWAYHSWVREVKGEHPRAWVSEFIAEVDNARAFAQASALQIIQRAAHDGTWQAAAWFLERSSPQQWGRFERREVELTVSVETDVRSQLAEALAELGEDLLEDAVIDAEIHELQPERAPGAASPNGETGAAEPPVDGPGGSGSPGRLVVRRSA